MGRPGSRCGVCMDMSESGCGKVLNVSLCEGHFELNCLGFLWVAGGQYLLIALFL